MPTRVRFALVACFALGSLAQAQSLGARVSAVRDGVVRFEYARRPDACGDGRDVITLGRTLIVWPSITGHGTTDARCVDGPVRASVTLDGGTVTAIRIYVGGQWTASATDRDLGSVSARNASDYFLGLAQRLTGKAARSALTGAALADSVDVWRDLLALARDEDRPQDVRRSSMFWLGAVAPAEAVNPIDAIARDSRERREMREGALSVLGEIDDGAGVPALIAMTERDDAENPWLREKAVFWLGNAGDARGRARVRLLAERDSVPDRIRDQAIFALGHLDRDGDNGAFLRSLFGRLTSERLQKKVIQSLSQIDDPDGERFLLRLAQDDDQRMDLRKDALFWAGQNHNAETSELIAVYPKLTNRELKRHYTFVLSQRREEQAVDKLIDIAKNDGDHEVRRQALFWLGQSNDPKATRFLREMIER
jgi:HEAT repeat protein